MKILWILMEGSGGIGGDVSATKSVFARVVISTVELYRQLYRQKHSTGEISIQGVNHDRGRASDKLARPPKGSQHGSCISHSVQI